MRAHAQLEQAPLRDHLLPLAPVWSPLESIIQKKTKKRYAPQATPLWLLLYWERRDLHWPVMESLVCGPDTRRLKQFSRAAHLTTYVSLPRTNIVSGSYCPKKMIVSPWDEE